MWLIGLLSFIYKQVAPTGATVFSCTAPSYQNFPCMNVTYVTTLKVSCKLLTSQMLHLAVFLSNRFFTLKCPCYWRDEFLVVGVIVCCVGFQFSTPGYSKKDSTPCTPASGGQPTRAYMNFHHRTSSFSNQKTPI